MSSADRSDKMESRIKMERIGWILCIIVTAFFMFVIGYNISNDADTKLITDLNKQVADSHKLLDMMNKANDQYYNDTSLIFDAIRHAELDNFTMQNQISQHCFFKMTGKTASIEKCYDGSTVDERIQACMDMHDFQAFQMNQIRMKESYNRDLCTKEVKGQQ